mgnify:CR=1 FL=1
MRRIFLGAAMAAILAGTGFVPGPGTLPALAQADLFRPVVFVNDSAVTRYEVDQRVRFMQFLRAPDVDAAAAEKALIDDRLRLRARPNLRFAGQVTGVEGYVESAAMGLLAGRMAAAQALGRDLGPPPQTTAMGALVHHITGGADARTFQPMNVNFGLYPPLDEMRGGRKGRKDRYPAYTDRAKADFQAWLTTQ